MTATTETTGFFNFFKLPTRPALPAPLALPLRLIPAIAHSTALSTALNLVFAAAIRTDEFAFLCDRVVLIQVRDAQVSYRLRYAGPAGFVAGHTEQVPDLTISGALYDFLALATRREDSDTLFFNRRVVMEGDTALGLELKNVLDGMDPETLARPLPQILQAADRLMAAYERLSGQPG
ncbi:MAG: SCP2 sterol-binding domain-containing protein [Candidatus Contendobacter sp.]